MMLDLEGHRMDPLLVKHLEAHLGTILHGWSLDADGDTIPFQIVELSGGKEPSVHTYSTLGLSNHPLQSRVSNKEIRCELVMVARNGSDAIPGILQQVGKGLIQEGALLRGDVIGPRNPLINGSSMSALYASIPVYFPDSFATCDSAQGPIVFIWLIPIAQKEAFYIQKNGWSAFEKLLVGCDPDLSDLFRNSVIT